MVDRHRLAVLLKYLKFTSAESKEPKFTGTVSDAKNTFARTAAALQDAHDPLGSYAERQRSADQNASSELGYSL